MRAAKGQRGRATSSARYGERQRANASKHPAIVLWLVGNEMNGAWHLYVCNHLYAEPPPKEPPHDDTPLRDRYASCARW